MKNRRQKNNSRNLILWQNNILIQLITSTSTAETFRLIFIFTKKIILVLTSVIRDYWLKTLNTISLEQPIKI